MREVNVGSMRSTTGGHFKEEDWERDREARLRSGIKKRD